MAKLTDEQKEKNKAATSRRNKAFNQRKGLFCAEREAARMAVEAGPLGAASKQASAAREQALQCRDQALAEVDAQIEALRLIRTGREAEHRALIEAAAVEYRTAATAYQIAQQAAEAEVEARYEDVARCWSAGGWKPITEFMEADQ